MKSAIKANLNLCSANIIENREIAEDHFIMSLLLSEPCEPALPGQFIMMRKQGVKDPLLSRPLSIYGFYQTEAGCVFDFLYRVVGKGTRALSRLNCGDTVDILGPLGRPFVLAPEKKHILLVAGGIGVAPLSYFAEYLTKEFGQIESSAMPTEYREITFYLGATTSSSLVGLPKIERFCHHIKLATDDGSIGFHGTVTELLRCDLDKYDPGEFIIFSCGPKPMIKSLAKIMNPIPVPCQVSVEERMACGIGACLGCSVKVRTPDSDRWTYSQVCTDGPVFDIRDIMWDDQEN